MRYLAFIIFFFTAFFCNAQSGEAPVISFTFDDGSTSDYPGYPFKQWNAMLLDHLNEAGLKAVFFVTGRNKRDEKGKFLLESWDNAGHSIANHTFSHLNYGSEKVTFEDFTEEFLKTDTIIHQYRHYTRLFRFPYLKEGNTSEKVAAFRELLRKYNYRNGYVTIDASDWAIDARLRKRLESNPAADLEPYRRFYLEHLYNRAMYYDSLALLLTGRHISHTILLHHNLCSALFLKDLIAMFRAKGWKTIDAPMAFEDPIFLSQPKNIPAGESLIWALAHEQGGFDLRYPAEDDTYENPRMDALGL